MLENLIDLLLKILQENKFFNKFYYVCDGQSKCIYKIFCDLISTTFVKKPDILKSIKT